MSFGLARVSNKYIHIHISVIKSESNIKDVMST